MKIQIKKLAWVSGGIGKQCAIVGFIKFFIIEEDDDLFFLKVSVINTDFSFCSGWFTDVDSAKNYAKTWLEKQVIKFIETSENPAQ